MVDLSARILSGVGTPSDIAQRVARGLVLSNLKGVDSHGVIRVPQYVEYVRQGLIAADGRPVVERETPNTAVVDAHRGFGHFAADYCLRIAIRKALGGGVSTVTLRHTRHIGRVGEWVEMAVDAGCIGIAMCSAPSLVAPHGGKAAALGTNPIAIGIPTDGEFPYVMDYATSVISAGKTRQCLETGTPLPPDCVIDADGHSTDHAEDFYRFGILLPMATYKGYALSLSIEILGALLAGSGTALLDEPTLGPSTFGNGAVFIALNPASFGNAEHFRRRAGELCRAIKQTPLREGFREILVPGELEHRSEQQRRANGIPLSASTWTGLRETGRTVGIPLTDLEEAVLKR